MRSVALVLALTFATAGSLTAQRRGSGGSGSDGRRTPSGGGSSSGGSRAGSSSGRSSGSGSSASSGSRGSSSGSSASSGSGSGSGSSSGATEAQRGSASSGSTTSSTTRRKGSKIGAIRDAANHAGRSGGSVIVGPGIWIGSCWGCDYYGWYGERWGRYHGGWWYPTRDRYPRTPDNERDPVYGQGYEPYPYAGADNEAFVMPHTRARRSFGAVSGQFFSDAGSTTRAGRFGIEGARGLIRGEAEYSYYAEPVAGGTDRLHTYRLAAGVQPRLGDHAFLVGTMGLRGVVLDNGRSAAGPEGELGVQLLPRRPFGINVTGRAAALSWNSRDYFALRELNTTGSVFISRMELQAGWHWLKVGSNPAFGGPVVGMRVWF
jgi:hypothetical protein